MSLIYEGENCIICKKRSTPVVRCLLTKCTQRFSQHAPLIDLNYYNWTRASVIFEVDLKLNCSQISSTGNFWRAVSTSSFPLSVNRTLEQDNIQYKSVFVIHLLLCLWDQMYCSCMTSKKLGELTWLYLKQIFTTDRKLPNITNVFLFNKTFIYFCIFNINN